MRLNSIEIKGFKSFAEKTVINFNDKITGIVGPNGCGKSNIVDAIRWVLGEQKASHLRSEKMENLIFNGTKKRRAAGIAEVTMNFENTKNILPTEYSNISVSRIYYRNGESEYKLNNTPCRLKDILSLFMDTGVGSDSYAIIELKMIDDILSDKDNSRRILFEQAAGIEKYKKRKKETLSKLNSTQADLERVEDLLYEIEGNLKTLESQAKKTKRYYSLKEEYKDLSVELATHLLKDQNQIYKGIEAELRTEKDKKFLAETRIKRLEAKIEKIKLGSTHKEKELSKAQKDLNIALDQLRKLESEKQIKSEKLKFLGEKKENDKLVISNSQDRIQLNLEKLELLKNKQKAQKEVHEKASSLVQKLQSEQIVLQKEVEKINAEKDQAFHNLRNKENQITELERKIAVEKSKLNHRIEESKRIAEFATKANQEIKEAKESIKDPQNKQSILLKQLKEIESKEEKYQSDLEKTQLQIQKIKTRLDEELRTLDSKENEFRLTKNMIDNMEGFPESIKFLKKEVKHTEAAPLLSDTFTCKEEYRIAIEQYLDPYLSYYILPNLSTAVESIEVLNQASKGKANFFILEEFQNYKTESPIPPQNCISALELVKADKKYQTLLNWLLNDVYVCNAHQNSDLQEIWKSNPDKVILSVSGKFTRKKFRLSGGSIGLFEGKKIGRSQNLEKLEIDIEKVQVNIGQLKKEIGQLQDKENQLQNSLKNLKGQETKKELEEVERKILSINGRIKFIEDNLKERKSNSAEEIDITVFEAGIVKDEATLKEESKLIALERKGYEKLQSKHADFAEKLNSLNKNYNEKNLLYHQEDNALAAIIKDIAYVNQEALTLRDNLSSAEKGIAQSEVEIQNLQKDIQKHANDLDSLLKQKEALEKAVVEKEENYKETKEAIDKAEQELKEQSKEKEDSGSIISEIREKENALKIELASLKERLSVEFKVNLNNLVDREPNPEMDKDALLDKVEKIKSRLDNYGQINPMAIEAYNEMKKRFDFIQSQKNDLVEARKNLEETIKEIDATATDKFNETFNAVEENFQKVFKSLFREEDSCALVLVDPSNPLESKIEIKAQPKGKRPLTINQLSGGEKTLTSIALLFALYLIKPAPFCIFDEVDAPLDDANVGKFTEIIRKFSDNSQFIVVTHNKQTMMETDVIYGVTMVEEGISRVVPVDFSNLN